MPSMLRNPAKELEGQILEGGWTVGPLLVKNPRATGGNFCQCYKVRSQAGKVAFLKALDFHRAFEHGMEMIEKITVLYNFEREMLGECTKRRMDRVVEAIAHGEFQTDPKDPFTRVPQINCGLETKIPASRRNWS
jgi:hypothetical protein